MSDFDDDFAATLLADMFDEFGTSATYARGSSSATVTVIREKGDSITSGDTMRLHANVVRMRIKASQINFGSGAVEPAPGDTVTISGVEFRVEPFGDRDRPWEWGGEDRTTYVVDTVEA